MLRTWALVLCAAAAPLVAGAQSAFVIAGGVYEDRVALAVRPNFVAARNVSVKLYRDSGDRLPGADDVALASARTNAQGVYTFPPQRPGDYWVAVDSHSFAPNAWPEQTFGPGGSLCAHPDGSTRTIALEGSCFGGRTASGSDDASALATSEHVALVTLRDSSAMRVDFAFSFDAVTSVADGDDIQGSLRQFLLNANAVAGPNRMRFVPLTPAAEQRETNFGVPPRWWTITLGAALPEVRDADTVIDGNAYNFLSPASAANVHSGRLGEPVTMRPEEARISRLEKPELEIVATGSEGIACAARCGMRGFALRGATVALALRADAQIEHVVVGAEPDALPAAARGETGVAVERGTVVAHHLHVSSQSRAGIAVAKGAHFEGNRLEVTLCGQAESGAGIALFGDGSVIRSSTVAANGGAGIVLGSATETATGNTIDGCTISGNQAGVVLAPRTSRNVVTRNDIMWNRVGGITLLPFEPATAPTENRFSANRFDENGLRPIVLNLESEEPNALALGGTRCERVAGAPNGGIVPPRVTDVRVTTDNGAGRVVIQGQACPGEIVELYQSFVTSGVREKQADLPRVRADRKVRETVTEQERAMALPSIGEFNYLGATNTSADGKFEAAFPLPLIVATERRFVAQDETNIWADDVLRGADPSERAFSAISIDAAGNTSEMSVRRKVD